MRKFKGLAVAMALAVLAAGAASAEDVIKIGVYLPLTGNNAVGGQIELDGVQLAHAQYPEVNGQKIELVVADNKSDKVGAANAVKRLAEQNAYAALRIAYYAYVLEVSQVSLQGSGQELLKDLRVISAYLGG